MCSSFYPLSTLCIPPSILHLSCVLILLSFLYLVCSSFYPSPFSPFALLISVLFLSLSTFPLCTLYLFPLPFALFLSLLSYLFPSSSFAHNLLLLLTSTFASPANTISSSFPLLLSFTFFSLALFNSYRYYTSFFRFFHCFSSPSIIFFIPPLPSSFSYLSDSHSLPFFTTFIYLFTFLQFSCRIYFSSFSLFASPLYILYLLPVTLSLISPFSLFFSSLYSSSLFCCFAILFHFSFHLSSLRYIFIPFTPPPFTFSTHRPAHFHFMHSFIPSPFPAPFICLPSFSLHILQMFICSLSFLFSSFSSCLFFYAYHP